MPTLAELTAERDALLAQAGVIEVRTRDKTVKWDPEARQKRIASLDVQIAAMGGRKIVRQIRTTSVKDLG